MLQAAAELVFEMLTLVTGHVLLWALSLGRWRVFQGRDDGAMIAGLLFWVGIGVGLVLLLG